MSWFNPFLTRGGWGGGGVFVREQLTRDNQRARSSPSVFCTYNCSDCEMYVVLCSVVECVVWNGVSPEGCMTGVE